MQALYFLNVVMQDAHIKQKAKLIRELKAEVAVPYLVAVANKINNHVQKSNEDSEGVA